VLNIENIYIRFGRKIILKDISADFSPGSAWVIAGVNGSGKSVLGKVITDLLKPEKGILKGTVNTAYSSFELQDKIMDLERKKNSSRLMHGATDNGTSVEDWLCLEQYGDKIYADKLLTMFALNHVIKQGLRVLSTGELRKTILLSALLKKPDLLVIDDPFDGLDINSRANLKNVINTLAKNNQKIIIITNRIEDIFTECTHMLLLSNGSVKFSGIIEKGINLFKDELLMEKQLDLNPFFPLQDKQGRILNEVLIKMKDVSVNYGDLEVLNKINWEVKRGDKWKITGVNGSGKSTLLSLVNGDNQQAYSNNISLFGRIRGSGESIWDIKKRIGYVSGDFQLNYRVRTTVLDVILSGIYDSVGLYTEITNMDIEKGNRWLTFIGLTEKGKSMFRQLSYGEMRMVLLARAMIKNPDLLILDEPCQGLDTYNKNKVLALCEKIGSSAESTMLFVTHDQTINLNCFNNTLILEKNLIK
jgi:molybdate transport system ATP-binding protein